MVTQVGSRTKTERTAEIEQADLLAVLVQNRGLIIGQGNGQAFLGQVAQTLELFIGNLLDEGQGCHDHTRHYRCDEVNENRQAQNQHHQGQIPAWTFVGALHIGNIDDVIAHLHQNTRQHGVGNIGRQRCQGNHYRQQQHTVQHAGDLGLATGTDIYYRTHGGTGTGYRAEETGDSITDTLPDQFLVGLVPGAGHIVRHQRSQQAVDRAQQSQNDGCFQNNQQRIGAECRNNETGQAGGNITQNRRTGHHQAQYRTNNQCRQRTGNILAPLRRPLEDNDQGQQTQRQGYPVGIHYRTGNFHQRRNGATAFGLMTKQTAGLQGNNDTTDTTHEPGYHRIGHQAYVLPQLENTKGNLEQTRQNHSRKNQAGLTLQRRVDTGEYHHHGTGGSGYLGAGAAEQSGKETDNDGTIQTGNRTGTRGLTECQGKGQGHNAGRQATVDVAP